MRSAERDGANGRADRDIPLALNRALSAADSASVRVAELSEVIVAPASNCPEIAHAAGVSASGRDGDEIQADGNIALRDDADLACAADRIRVSVTQSTKVPSSPAADLAAIETSANVTLGDSDIHDRAAGGDVAGRNDRRPDSIGHVARRAVSESGILPVSPATHCTRDQDGTRTVAAGGDLHGLSAERDGSSLIDAPPNAITDIRTLTIAELPTRAAAPTMNVTTFDERTRMPRPRSKLKHRLVEREVPGGDDAYAGAIANIRGGSIPELPMRSRTPTANCARADQRARVFAAQREADGTSTDRNVTGDCDRRSNAVSNVARVVISEPTL
jgi:hypothetical protein